MLQQLLLAVLVLQCGTFVLLGVMIWLFTAERTHQRHTDTADMSPPINPVPADVMLAVLDRMVRVVSPDVADSGPRSAEGVGGAASHLAPFYAVEQPDDSDPTDAYLPRRRQEAVVLGDAATDDDNPFGIEGLKTPMYNN